MSDKLYELNKILDPRDWNIFTETNFNLTVVHAICNMSTTYGLDDDAAPYVIPLNDGTNIEVFGINLWTVIKDIIHHLQDCPLSKIGMN